MSMEQVGTVAAKITDRWAWWTRALAHPGDIGRSLPIHEGEPEQGYYRTKNRAGAFDPVAIFYPEDSDQIVAYRNNREVDPSEIWSFCCRHPVSYDAYQRAVAGDGWEDDDPTVAAQIAPAPPGHNSGEIDEAEVLQDQIDAARQGADAYKVIEDENALKKAQSLRSRLNELSGEAEKKRVALKAPHLEAGKAVDAKWQPIVRSAKDAADGIRKAMEAFQTAQLRKQREAEEARRRAEEEARKTAEAGKPADTPEPPPAPVQAAPTPIKGTYGKAASVGVKNVVTEINDWDALWAFLRDHPEVKVLFQKLAQRAVDRNFTVPGVRVEEQATVR